MKIARAFAVVACIVLFSYSAFAAQYCLNCFERIDESEKYCVACKAKLSVDKLKSQEEQLIHAVTVSRENYQKSLEGLKEYYNSAGNQLRLNKARTELDALNNVPLPLYKDEGLGNVQVTKVYRDIEDANILFKDAMMYKKKFSKENRAIAIKRFERLLSEYPDSDKVGDSAFEVAEIYASRDFKDYESAAKYYVKSYQLNPYIKRPALIHAAEIYDKRLADYNMARIMYRQAALYSPTEKQCKKAKSRLAELDELAGKN